jgi:biotin operon repressor
MTLAKQNELLKRMASLISQGHTGNAKALGNRIGISRSSVFTYLDRLRTLGAEIEFSERRRSYVYVNNKKPRFLE